MFACALVVHLCNWRQILKTNADTPASPRDDAIDLRYVVAAHTPVPTMEPPSTRATRHLGGRAQPSTADRTATEAAMALAERRTTPETTLRMPPPSPATAGKYRK
jgi:hypothetical protein